LTISFFRWFVADACTAITIVNDESSSTTVFNAPSGLLR
jgi:hypothetical protein